MELIAITQECADDFRTVASRVRSMHLRNCLLLCADQREFFAERLRQHSVRYNPEVEHLQAWRELGRAWQTRRVAPIEMGDVALFERLAHEDRLADQFYQLALEGLERTDPVAALIQAQRHSVSEDECEVRQLLEE